MVYRLFLVGFISISSVAVYAETAVSGIWQGQVEYLDSSSQATNEVVPFAFKLMPTGEMIGTTPLNSCMLLGLYRNGYGAEGQYNVDFSLKNCRNSVFNGRYSGSIWFKNHFQDGRFTAQGNRTIQVNNQPRFLVVSLSANFFKK